jgi:hypothetical protein
MEHRISRAAIRHVILQYNLVGNAQQLIERVLDKNFGDGLVRLNGDSSTSTLNNRDLLEFLCANPGVLSIASHHLRPPKPHSSFFVFFDVLILRDPLDRIYAMYDAHRRGLGSIKSLREPAENGDLDEFLKGLMTDHPHLINNVQVNYLASGGKYYRPPCQSDLHKAVKIMREAALPGVTSILDISLVTGEYYLRPAFGDLDFSYVSPHPCSIAQAGRARVDELRDRCHGTIYAHLLEMNSLDTELVQLTEAEIYRRFQLIPFRDQRRAEFLDRCRKSVEYFLEHDTVDA